MISVVIPAHNESLVIGSLLDRLEPGARSGEIEVVVVANGCRDDTAEVADVYTTTVIDLPDGSKVAALEAGDAAASHFPRFYVDADISIGGDDLLEMASALTGGALAISPQLQLDLSGANWAVRSYHRIWKELPSVAHSLAGRGCFGLSAEGRSRWEMWPDVVADDQFVNQQFGDSEKLIHPTIGSKVRLPANLRNLVSRKRRSQRGNVELEAAGPTKVTSTTAWLGVVRRDPRRLIDVPIYVGVTLVVRLLARRDLRGGAAVWSSDPTSRER